MSQIFECPDCNSKLSLALAGSLTCSCGQLTVTRDANGTCTTNENAQCRVSESKKEGHPENLVE